MHKEESTVSGSIQSCCTRISFSNLYGEYPSIDIQEESTMTVEGRQPINVGLNHLSVEFGADKTIPLRDIDTNELTGKTVTHDELRTILYSLYKQACS